jgi:outer membrane receptor protein involved in Fe transport
MTKRRQTPVLLVRFAILLLAPGGAAHAQGTQTSAMTGSVTFSDDKPLPGVNVTLSSPGLQGERTGVSDGNGGFIFKGLPPGPYKVVFELQGMNGVERNVTLALGQTLTLDARLSLKGVQEAMVVTAEAPSPLEGMEGRANYGGQEIDQLPTGRTIVATAELAPGVSDNVPTPGQLRISGSFAYDTLFLIDGVDAADNFFSSLGGTNTPFIEDAIEETQILTSGISAEFGRFSGGVINAITKKGGNTFSGSFRADLGKPSWRERTPLEQENGIELGKDLGKAFQATVGGPIVKDRLWFFGAGRTEKSSTQGTFPFSAIPFTRDTDNKRLEGKLTGTIAANHTLQASYTLNNTNVDGPTLPVSIAPSTIDEGRRQNDLFVASYRGVLRSNLFAELQFSRKTYGVRDRNGDDTNLVTGSPFFTFGNSELVEEGQHYNGPYFDEFHDPEDRNNRQLTGNLSYFLSSKSGGNHDLKAGFEYFESTVRGGNSQSPTGFVYFADYKTDDEGDPVLLPDGNLIPVFEPFGGLLFDWMATRGARLDLKTTSLYLNDRWQLGRRLSFNLGVRYEKVTSQTSVQNIVGIEAQTVVPRLGASFDVKGDGAFKLDATYAHYASKYNPALFGSNQPAGFPDLVIGLYVGPSGEGQGFAPGFDPQNYSFLEAEFPTVNVFFDEHLKSPLTQEFTASAGAQLGKGGYAKLLYTWRNTSRFVESFTTFDLGQVEFNSTSPCQDCQGPFLIDKKVYRNTDDPERKYQALQLQVDYRLAQKWRFSGHWTVQLENEGDFEGEAPSAPAADSFFGDYPEILVADRNFPKGRLSGFQRHKVRAWTTYDLGLGRAGNLNVGLLWRYDSAPSYSLVAENQEPSEIQLSRDPGYATPPSLVDVFFGKRGIGNFRGAHLFDIALTYDIPVKKSLRPYVKLDIRNVLNNDTLGAGPEGFNTTIRPDDEGPADANGIPTAFVRSPNFGEAVSNDSFPAPREVRIALGFRF